MPDEYISREAALKAANEWVSEACMAPVMRVSRLLDKLAKVPAADVAEVVHGEWLRSDDDWNSLTTIQCSCCGEEWCFETDDDVSLLNYKYCPNCGARMDGGKDDEAD